MEIEETEHTTQELRHVNYQYSFLLEPLKMFTNVDHVICPLSVTINNAEFKRVHEDAEFCTYV